MHVVTPLPQQNPTIHPLYISTRLAEREWNIIFQEQLQVPPLIAPKPLYALRTTQQPTYNHTNIALSDIDPALTPSEAATPRTVTPGKKLKEHQSVEKHANRYDATYDAPPADSLAICVDGIVYPQFDAQAQRDVQNYTAIRDAHRACLLQGTNISHRIIPQIDSQIDFVDYEKGMLHDKYRTRTHTGSELEDETDGLNCKVKKLEKHRDDLIHQLISITEAAHDHIDRDYAFIPQTQAFNNNIGETISWEHVRRQISLAHNTETERQRSGVILAGPSGCVTPIPTPSPSEVDAWRQTILRKGPHAPTVPAPLDSPVTQGNDPVQADTSSVSTSTPPTPPALENVTSPDNSQPMADVSESENDALGELGLAIRIYNDNNLESIQLESSKELPGGRTP
jgi:hypothetical protein